MNKFFEDMKNSEQIVQPRTFAQLKPGDYVFYYKKYKIHSLKVVEAEMREFTETIYDYEMNELHRKKKKFYLKFDNGYETYLDPALADDRTQLKLGNDDSQWFSGFNHALDYINSRIAFCQNKIDSASKTIEKHQQLKKNYERCHDEALVALCIDITKNTSFGLMQN